MAASLYMRTLTSSRLNDSYFKSPDLCRASHSCLVSMNPRGPIPMKSSASVLSRKVVSPRNSAFAQASARRITSCSVFSRFIWNLLLRAQKSTTNFCLLQNQLTYSVIRCIVYPVKGRVELAGLTPWPPLHQRWRGGKGDCSIRFEDTALWNDIPTINWQGHTRYIGCRIGAEPEDGFSRFCWIGHAPQRYAARDALPDLLIRDPSFVHRGAGRARGNGIDANVLPAVFERCSLRQADDPVFTGNVGSDSRSGANQSHRGTQVDDGSSSTRKHRRDLVLHTQEYALEIDCDNAIKHFLGHLHQWLVASCNASVVDRNIEPSVGVNGAFDEGLDRGCFSHIRLDRHRLASVGPDLFHDACHLLFTTGS